MTSPVTTRASTAVELVARLYVSAHARSGDLTTGHVGGPPVLPEGDAQERELRTRYFGDDFALGTNLAATAVAHRWWTVDALVRGVRLMPPRDLVAALLSSTTLSAPDRDRSTVLVAAALDGATGRRGRAGEIARLSSFRRATVEHLLRDPERAHREIDELLRSAAAALEPTTRRVASTLRSRRTEVETLLASRGRAAGLLELTGGWTLRDSDHAVVVVPVLVDTPLVITRLLPDGRLLLVFSGAARSEDGSPEALAAVAHALGSEQRLAILRLVGRRPMTGQRLAEALDLTPATVHYHTAMLRSVGLVTSVRDAQSVLHSLDAVRLRTALARLGDLVAGGEDQGAAGD